MNEPMNGERLAEILWIARKRALGYDDATPALSAMGPDTRAQYGQFAEEVAKLLDQDRELVGLAEIAHAAGVTNVAVANWVARYDDFPAPVVVLRCGSVWSWMQVADWLTCNDKPVHEIHPPASRTRVRRTLDGMGKPFGWFTNQRRAGESAR